MSWLRSTVYRAMEVRNKNNGNQSHIRSIADLDVLHVVARGAYLLQIGNQNIESFIHNIQKLEKVMISCKGEERVILLRQVLASMEQVERNKKCFKDEDSVKLFDANEIGKKHEELQHKSHNDQDHLRDANMKYHEVFLRSNVVEGIILSTILVAPNNEERTLILEIFRHSIMGEKEVHNRIMSGIQELSNVFSSYHDEVLMRREELLQNAQIAVSGLKVNADIERIDMEVSTIKSKLHETKLLITDDDVEISSKQQKALMTMEALKDALSKIRMHAKLKENLLQKKAIRDGDCRESHAQKINKMKVLLESLAKSTLKAEKHILDSRSYKNETLQYRVVKATEACKVEKEIEAEIETLEGQKYELEKILHKVNASLVGAKAELHDVKEEKDHFEEASNSIIYHIQLREKELSKTITACTVEKDVITTLIRFVEDAWNVQVPFLKQLEKQHSDELETHSKQYTEMILQLLHKYKAELGNLVTRFRTLIRQLKSSNEVGDKSTIDDESFPITVTKTSLEEEFLDLQDRLVDAFGLVKDMEKIHTQSKGFSRDSEKQVDELFDTLEKMKVEFESIERPSLQCETQKRLIWQGSPLKLKPRETSNDNDFSTTEYNEGTIVDWNSLGLEEGTPQSNSAKHNRGHKSHDSIDWEFDAIEN